MKFESYKNCDTIQIVEILLFKLYELSFELNPVIINL